MSNEKNILEGLLATVKSKTRLNEHYLYHLKTVTNYIQYFDELEYSAKRKAFDLLHDYLSLIEQKWGPERKESLELFKEFIYPLVICYEQLGFTSYVPIWMLTIWLLVIEGCLYFFTQNPIILSLVVIPFVSYYLYINNKKREGKVHGFNF